MNRSPSMLAQFVFDTVNKLTDLSAHAGWPASLFARAANKAVLPALRALGPGHIVSARLYGHMLTMPAEHALPPTVARFPQYNRPLGMAAEAIAASYPSAVPLGIIDVGANIGETIAIIQDRRPGRFSYLCIDADPDLANMCVTNHIGNDKVQVQQCFIGEDEGALVWLQDDGLANPSTKLESASSGDGASNQGTLKRLDTVASAFAAANGLGLIKVDTEGYDFSVLRSAANLLTTYKPALYFEWFPRLLTDLKEEAWDGFEYLASLGYRYFVFFTNRGDFYCSVTDPDKLFLRSLVSVTRTNSTVPYFDVFASVHQDVTNTLIEGCIALSEHK